jgi:hypothetical protein
MLMAGAPVATAGAGEAVLYVVHGIPGVRADVCIAGLGEVASGMKYATRFREELAPGTAKIRVRAASKGQCKGAVLATASVPLANGANVTAVARLEAGDPTIEVFENDLSPTPPGEFRITAAHMMKGGALDVYVGDEVEIPGLARGDQADITRSVGLFTIFATRAGKTTPIVGPRTVTSATDGSAYTFVMVGSKVENNAFVVFKQPVTPPA